MAKKVSNRHGPSTHEYKAGRQPKPDTRHKKLVKSDVRKRKGKQGG